MNITLSVHTLAPLAHGGFGPSTGNVVPCRRMAVATPDGLQYVPCVSGAALRGVVRRIVMRHVLDAVALDRSNVPGWDRLYAALCCGGHLDQAAAKHVDPDARRTLRAALPPLSLLGASLYSYGLPGRVSPGILWPVTRETVEWGLVIGDTDLSLADLTEEVGLARHVDRDEMDSVVAGVTPMPRTVEAIIAGVELQSYLVFARGSTELEIASFLWGCARVTHLGGHANAGLGRVEVRVHGRTGIPDESAFDAWLDEHAGAIREALLALADTLGAAPRKAKKAKKAKEPTP